MRSNRILGRIFNTTRGATPLQEVRPIIHVRPWASVDRTLVCSAMRSLIVLFFAVIFAFAKHGEGERESDNDKSSSTAPAVTTSPPSSSSQSSLATPTSSSPPSTSMVPFHFLPPSNTTTCQNMTIKWTYTATMDVLMTITITNERGAGIQSVAPSNGTTLVSRTLTDAIPAKAQQILWNTVDVPSGTYVAVAFDTDGSAGISAASSPFFVLNGQDTSCLASNKSATASVSTQSVSSQTSVSHTPTAAGASSPSESGGSNAASLATPPKALSPGALAGTIVGIIVGVILLLIAFSYPHLWRHSLPNPARSRRPGGPYLLF
ncbi:hypothetical protein NLI96_g1771 [Meripilus lineatus]|uniref:Uncharacterized protein n=1 Tax=Meripilus lineatus TaxID=2056292 RepID=A0AAD5YKL3_9APHY|nr:hypothetical protein NLI96_g1771 [Physisporinus lineatus]